MDENERELQGAEFVVERRLVGPAQWAAWRQVWVELFAMAAELSERETPPAGAPAADRVSFAEPVTRRDEVAERVRRRAAARRRASGG